MKKNLRIQLFQELTKRYSQLKASLKSEKSLKGLIAIRVEMKKIFQKVFGIARSFRMSIAGFMVFLSVSAINLNAEAVFTLRAGTNNPFNGIDPGSHSNTDLVDIDSDGDLDVFIGSGDGTFQYWENTGTSLAPTFTQRTGGNNPLDGIDLVYYSAPNFVDIDGDGDYDALLGRDNGQITFYENTGTAIAPVFTLQAGTFNPLNGVDIGTWSDIDFKDLDGDGDFDAIIGEDYGVLYYYENTGTSVAPTFTARTGTNNPFNGIDIGNRSTPNLSDIDGDGDFDLFSGDHFGGIFYYENTGTALDPAFTARTGTNNPLNAVNFNNHSTIDLADINGDGDLDAILGQNDGSFVYYENTGVNSLSNADINFIEQTGTNNPFEGVDFDNTNIYLVDIDSDGDLDAFIGEVDGNIKYFENTGTALVPVFTERTGANNPFDGVGIGSYSTLNIIDIDGDGDLDAFLGENDGIMNYFENTGTALVPVFTERTGANNPFDGVDIGNFSVPSLVDIDSDGDFDAFIGDLYGNIFYYENTGTALAPTFTERTGVNNAFNGLSFGNNAAPLFVDIDIDGDLDAFIGELNGIISYYENTGTALAPAFTHQTGTNNPFDGIDIGQNSVLYLDDIDSDGDLDAFIGEYDGIVNYFLNAPPTEEAPVAYLPIISEITSNSASFTVEVFDGDDITTVTFEYGTSSGNYSATTTGVELSANSATQTASFDASGLNPETHYYLIARAENSVDYSISSEVDFWTFATEPSNHSNTFYQIGQNLNTITIAFQSPASISADGYIVLRSESTPNTNPTDGVGYTVGQTLGNAVIAAIITNTNSTSAELTNLAQQKNYVLRLIPFNWNGNDEETYNYRTASAPQSAMFTVPTLGEWGMIAFTISLAGLGVWFVRKRIV